MATVGYQTILTNIYNALNNVKATTLSTSLTAAVRQVIKGDPNIIPVQITQYPAVFVHLLDKTENYGSMGTSLRNTMVNFEIYGFVNLSTGSDNSDAEARQLADNIEGILRGDTTLANTVDYINPKSCTFDRAVTKDGVYVSACLINLEVKKTVK